MSVARSLDLDEDSFVEPVEDKEEAPDDKPSRHIRRRANVYDAIAGMFSKLAELPDRTKSNPN